MHAGPFEAGADDMLAAGLDDTGGDTQAHGAELRVAHAVTVAAEVVDATPRRVVAGVAAQGAQQGVEAAVVEFVLAAARGGVDLPKGPLRVFLTDKGERDVLRITRG